jgi:hypothetical protein
MENEIITEIELEILDGLFYKKIESDEDLLELEEIFNEEEQILSSLCV